MRVHARYTKETEQEEQEPVPDVFDIDATQEIGLLVTVHLGNGILRIHSFCLDLHADISDFGSNSMEAIKNIANSNAVDTILERVAKPIWFDLEQSRERTKANIRELIRDPDVLDNVLDEINGYVAENPRPESFLMYVKQAFAMHAPELLGKANVVTDIDFGYNPYIRKIICSVIKAFSKM